MRKSLLLLMVAAVWLLCPLLAGAESPKDTTGDKPMLRAAIFVQNRAGEALQDQVDVLNDQVSAALTQRGFSIIDKNLVIAKFRESRGQDAELSQKLKALEQTLSREKSDASVSVEDALSGASALRIAQMIGADYLVVASINSVSSETRTFKGEGTAYGSNNQSTVFNLRLSLKVLEANQGGSVYGDTVTASERVAVGQNLHISTSEILPKLMESGARKIGDRIAGNVEQIRNVKVKSVPVVEFSLNSNVEGAVVELDGAVIGSTPGRFAAAPGLHQIKVTKEWLTPWERTVNVIPNQALNVSLELSEEGLRRYATIEQLKVDLARNKAQNEMEMKEREAGVGIAKEQSEAEAFSKKAIAEGEKTRREESYERIEGPPTVVNPAGAVNAIVPVPVK